MNEIGCSHRITQPLTTSCSAISLPRHLGGPGSGSIDNVLHRSYGPGTGTGSAPGQGPG